MNHKGITRRLYGMVIAVTLAASYALAAGRTSEPGVRVQADKEPSSTHSISTTSSRNAEVLEKDLRLKVKVTLARNRGTLADALRELSSLTKISFAAEGNEVQMRRLTFQYDNVPLKDILDSLSELFGYEWERTKGGVFILRESQEKLAKNGLPEETEEQKEVAKEGEKFKEQMEKLPPDARHALEGDYAVSFTDLPPSMQETARNMLTSRLHIEESRLVGESGTFASVRLGAYQQVLGNLDSTRVRWRVNRQEGRTYCHLSFSIPNRVGVTVSFRGK